MLLRWFPVYRREIKTYLQSPGVYVVTSFFFGLAGLFFFQLLWRFVQVSQNYQLRYQFGLEKINVTEIVISNTFDLLNSLMLFAMPILTMRLISEEKKLGTFELLATMPLRDWDILLGKFFACLTVAGFLLVLCLIFPGVVMKYGEPEIPVIVACYVGLFLIVMAYSAFGLFASSLTESQIAASIITFSGLLVFYLVGNLALAETGTVATILKTLSVLQHSEKFTKGVINLTDVLYFVLFTLFFLVMTAKVLEARRWRV